MLNEIFRKRLQDLHDHLEQDRELLQEFENALRDDDDILRVRRYKKQVRIIKESIVNYTEEYQEIEQQLSETSQPQMQVVKNQLHLIENQIDQIDAKLNIVLFNQDSLLNRYDAAEQSILKVIIEQLNHTQLVLIEKMLDAIETNQISESEMQHMLVVLEERIPSLSLSSQPAVAEIIQSPQLDAKHKLVVSMPIVPFLINYEGELELGTGFNLQSAWDYIMNKLRRK
ncbi:hypothetical protein H6F47_17480 [Sphaerospermopsis sp. FACHB-1094]|uniref:hypothetical protein n=1 Tax=Sphaerospermopsis sp. FACHB-1094 TaxID=2692861 RepID=UPI00168480BC|nr:hypothetical protein [Sphaerospermopsis sp. FACHB-1094]